MNRFWAVENLKFKFALICVCSVFSRDEASQYNDISRIRLTITAVWQLLRSYASATSVAPHHLHLYRMRGIPHLALMIHYLHDVVKSIFFFESLCPSVGLCKILLKYCRLGRFYSISSHSFLSVSVLWSAPCPTVRDFFLVLHLFLDGLFPIIPAYEIFVWSLSNYYNPPLSR